MTDHETDPVARWATLAAIVVVALGCAVSMAADPVEARRPSLGEWRSLQPILRRPVRFRPAVLFDAGGGWWLKKSDGGYMPMSSAEKHLGVL